MDETQHPLHRRHFLSTAAAAMAAGLAPGLALANTDFPSRPVTIIVPFAPGGGSDMLARMLATELPKHLKGTFVVENRPGAGGQIGTAQAARSTPDGHTLLLGITTLVQAPNLYKSLPYDVFKDFSPLAQIATSVNFLVVPASSPVKTYKEFVDFAQARKGKLSYGSHGNAGTSHLHGALFNSLLNLDMVHVPHSGSAPLLTALLGAQVDVGFVDIAPLRPHVLSGKLRVLAVTGPTRSPMFPDTPTFAELGVPGFEPVGWFSLFAPSGVPDSIRTTISNAAMKVVHSPEVIKRLEDAGLAPSQMTPQAFAQSMRPDMAKWQKMIQAGNVRVD